MGMGLKDMMTLRGAISGFMTRHPKVAPFAEGVRRGGFVVGQEVAIAIRYPDGQEYKAGIRVTQEDLDMLQTLKSMQKDAQ